MPIKVAQKVKAKAKKAKAKTKPKVFKDDQEAVEVMNARPLTRAKDRDWTREEVNEFHRSLRASEHLVRMIQQQNEWRESLKQPIPPTPVLDVYQLAEQNLRSVAATEISSGRYEVAANLMSSLNELARINAGKV